MVVKFPDRNNLSREELLVIIILRLKKEEDLKKYKPEEVLQSFFGESPRDWSRNKLQSFLEMYIPAEISRAFNS